MKKSKRLLVICPTLSDKGLAASFRLIHLLDHFLSEGVYITAYVLDSDISSVLKNVKYGKHLAIHTVYQRNGIYYKIRNRLFGVPDSMIFWGNKAKQEVLRSYKPDSFDAVFTSSPPHSLQVVGMKISKAFNIPHFTDFRDDWMDSHRLRHMTPLHRYLSKKAEYNVLEHSALITHAIPFVAESWKIKYKRFSEKIHSLTNGYPNSVLNYKTNNKTISYPKNTIVYLGGAYGNFVIEKFTKLREELIKSGLSEKWMIITGGPFEIPFKEDEVWVHYGNVSQDKVYNYLYNGNIHISLLPPGDLRPSRTIPLKLYTQITTKGVCVFIGNEGATTDLFKNIEGVYFFDNNGWDKLIPFIQNDEQKFTKEYKRENIDVFNYKLISKKLLAYIDKEL